MPKLTDISAEVLFVLSANRAVRDSIMQGTANEEFGFLDE